MPVNAEKTRSPAPGCAPAVLFDLDGVLVDSRRAIAGALNHALAQHGLARRPEARLHGWIGHPLHAVFVELLREQGAPETLAASCVAAYREHYRQSSLVETRTFPGIPALLARLGTRRPLAVATAKPVEFARPILAALGLLGHFAAVCGPALDARVEPKAASVARALAALGLALPGPGCAAVLVGDRRHDVEAGRACGIRTVGVGWGIGSERELRGAGSDHYVATPAELAALLERL